MGKREDNRDRTRRAIESSALALYRANGPGRTSIDDICASAGVGRRTFFRYFSSKDDVLLSRLRIDAGIVRTIFREANGDERMIDVLLRSARAVLHDHEFPREFVDVAFGSPELRSMFLGMLADFEDQLAPMIADRRGPGADEVETRIIAAVTVGGFRIGLQAWLDSPSPADPFPEVERAMTRALTGPLV